MRYTVIIESGRESGSVALCPALPGCMSQGRTKREVLKNIKEAIEAYIESLLEDGLPAPVERGRETVDVEIAAGANPSRKSSCPPMPVSTRGPWPQSSMPPV